MIASEAKCFAEEIGYEILNIVHESEHKRTAVLRAISNNCVVIIKVWFKGASGVVITAFKREIKYYNLLENVVGIPKLIAEGKNYIVLEEVQGKTLWNFYQEEDVGTVLAIDHARQIAKRLSDFNTKVDFLKNKRSRFGLYDTTRSLIIKLKELFYSGPKGTKNYSIEQLILKSTFFVSLPVVTFFLFFYVRKISDEAYGQRYHGDLHMNNLLVNSKGEIYLIDFECVTETPLMIGDLAYCCGTHSALCASSSSIINVYRDEFYQSEKKAAIGYILNLFVSAAHANPRFNTKIRRLSMLRIYLYFKSIFGITTL